MANCEQDPDCKVNRLSYDLDLVQQLCREIGLSARLTDVNHMYVDLGEGVVLCFRTPKVRQTVLSGSPLMFTVRMPSTNTILSDSEIIAATSN